MVTVVLSLEARFSFAVTVVDSPSSLIESADSSSVTVGASSSSVMVSVTSVGSVTPWLLPAVPDTRTFLSGVSTSLLLALIVTVPVLPVRPAAMVSVWFVLSVKSPSTAGETAVADTETVVVSLEARFSLALTVVNPRFSP